MLTVPVFTLEKSWRLPRHQRETNGPPEQRCKAFCNLYRSRLAFDRFSITNSDYIVNTYGDKNITVGDKLLSYEEICFCGEWKRKRPVRASFNGIFLQAIEPLLPCQLFDSSHYIQYFDIEGSGSMVQAMVSHLPVRSA